MKTEGKRQKLYDIIGFIFAVLGAALIIMCSMRVWEIDFNVPITQNGTDTLLNTFLIKSIFDNGINGCWYNPSVGMPDGSSLIDAPFFNTDLVLEIALLSKLLPSANAVRSAAYFLTYPLSAGLMYVLARKITNNNLLCVTGSILFAITPYHIYRGLIHLTLSHYYVVPVAILLMIIIYEEQFTAIVPTRYLKREERWKIVALYFGAIVLGLSNIYYAFFGAMCMAVGVIAKSMKDKTAKTIVKEAVPVYVVLLSVLAGMLKKIIFTAQNGENTLITARFAQESEVYALKIIQMILPASFNRIGLLRRINALYSENAINVNENAWSSLGTIASLGFICICIWTYIRFACDVRMDNKNVKKMNLLSLASLSIVLYSVGGGFGALVNYYVTPMLRALNRSSIYIACMSLCVIMVLMDYCIKKYRGSKQEIVCYLIIIISLLFSIYSEVPVYPKDWQKSIRESDTQLKTFFSKVEDSLDEGAMVYELPHINYPEEPVLYNMESCYEPILPYLYTQSVRWSYGGVKGRDTTAESLYIDEGMSDAFIKKIKDAGFEGVYIDTKGYPDSGEKILSFYKKKLGLKGISTEDGWLYFFKL